MPTTNKRINLTIPENIYERLENYKQKNGITSDASACLQLIVRQLDAIENSEKLLKMVSSIPMEELQRISGEGFSLIKDLSEKKFNP